MDAAAVISMKQTEYTSTTANLLKKVRHLIDRHNPELFEHIILVFVIHQHGTQHPQHHRQDDPRGIAERRPLVKLDGFHAGSLTLAK